MQSNEERSLIPLPSHELTVPLGRADRILGEMVESSLALAKQTAPANVDLDAFVREGKRIQRRKGMTSEDIQAFKLFHQAASGGHSEGQFRVSDCFRFGLGVPKDPNTCLSWLHKAVESGFALSDDDIHSRFRDGSGGMQGEDSVTDGGLFRKAFEQRADFVELRAAGERGESSAQNLLGASYETLFEFDEAAKWYRKAAEQGVGLAQNFMGMAHHVGCSGDIEIDLRHACAWYQLAADSGFEGAVGKAQVIAKRLNPEQLRVARALYREFKEKYSAKR